MFDPKKKLKRAENSQNFLKNPSQGKYLVDLVGINENDDVLEIGPGSGILTESLLKKASRVIAVEKDTELVEILNNKLGTDPKLRIIQADILTYKIELKNYKVFTNPPFSISSSLIKKLVFIPNPASEIYVFLQKEFAYRLTGRHFNTQLSALVKALYSVSVVYEFKREDFAPVPGVDVVLVQLKKLEKIRIKPENQAMFIKFVAFGFQVQKSYLQKSLEKIFTYDQWKKLSKDLKFDLKYKSGELSQQQWIGLFEVFISPLVAANKRGVVDGVRLD